MQTKDLQKIWNQVPANYYEELASNNFLQTIWHEKKVSVLKSLLDKNARNLLDIGCASGNKTSHIKVYLPQTRITGIDIYKPFVDYCQKNHPKIKCILTDAHNLPFINYEFDTVVCDEILDHVVDPEKVLLEVKRVLKKRGTLIVSLDCISPLFRFIWFFWTLVGPGRVWRGAHLHQFDNKSLIRIFKLMGFKLVKKQTAFLGMIVYYRLQKM